MTQSRVINLKRSPLYAVPLLAFFSLTFTESVLSEELPAHLSRTAPTPCLDFVASLYVERMIDTDIHAFLDGTRKKGTTPSTFVPGNREYDDAYRTLHDALTADKPFMELLRRANAQSYLVSIFRRGNEVDLARLSRFYLTPAGHTQWHYIVDGAGCKGLLNRLDTAAMSLGAPDARQLSDVRTNLDNQPQSFTTAYQKLSSAEQTELNWATALFTRLNSETPFDQADYEKSVVPTAEVLARFGVVLEPLKPKLRAIIEASRSAQQGR